MCDSLRAVAASLPPGLQLARRPDGVLMLRTGFRFPDGDGFVTQVAEIRLGRVRLSDPGHTAMHTSHDHDVDALLCPEGLATLDRILATSGTLHTRR